MVDKFFTVGLNNIFYMSALNKLQKLPALNTFNIF